MTLVRPRPTLMDAIARARPHLGGTVNDESWPSVLRNGFWFLLCVVIFIAWTSVQ